MQNTAVRLRSLYSWLVIPLSDPAIKPALHTSLDVFFVLVFILGGELFGPPPKDLPSRPKSSPIKDVLNVFDPRHVILSRTACAAACRPAPVGRINLNGPAGLRLLLSMRLKRRDPHRKEDE